MNTNKIFMKKQELFPKMLLNIKCYKKFCGPEYCGNKNYVRFVLSILYIRFFRMSSDPKANMYS